MVDKKRRSILRGAVGVGAASAAGSAQAGWADGLWPWTRRERERRTIPRTEESHRVVIIGSGFGGGVSALRLAEAGVPSLVLERGLRWPTGPNATTFPDSNNLDKRALFYSGDRFRGFLAGMAQVPGLLGLPALGDAIEPYAGLIEPVINPNMTVLVPAGVGGGSLTYQGMTLEPTEALFNRVLPRDLDYQRMHEIHYPRVAKMLQVEKAPDELIESSNYFASRYWKKKTEAAGYDVEKIDMPIDWTFALQELDGVMNPSYTNGDCAIGVNNGGKHSVDVTYIAQAEATGLTQVRTLHNVQSIARRNDGKWRIDVDVTDESGRTIEKKRITCRALIMAAGSVNSTKLLLRAQAQNTVPNLPRALGTGWGTNADRIVAWTTNLLEGLGDVQGGPVVFGSKEWADPDIANTVIQASIPPFAGDIRTTMMVGYGISDDRGTWRYDVLSDDIFLDWPRRGDAHVHERILERMNNISDRFSLLIDTNRIVPSTWHPLGGANMETVCDLEGRVHGQPGLYVLDGALIPGSSAACNPSMTIAAVAERAMDDIVVNDIGRFI